MKYQIKKEKGKFVATITWIQIGSKEEKSKEVLRTPNELIIIGESYGILEKEGEFYNLYLPIYRNDGIYFELWHPAAVSKAVTHIKTYEVFNQYLLYSVELPEKEQYWQLIRLGGDHCAINALNKAEVLKTEGKKWEKHEKYLKKRFNQITKFSEPTYFERQLCKEDICTLKSGSQYVMVTNNNWKPVIDYFDGKVDLLSKKCFRLCQDNGFSLVHFEMKDGKIDRFFGPYPKIVPIEKELDMFYTEIFPKGYFALNVSNKKIAVCFYVNEKEYILKFPRPVHSVGIRRYKTQKKSRVISVRYEFNNVQGGEEVFFLENGDCFKITF